MNTAKKRWPAAIQALLDSHGEGSADRGKYRLIDPHANRIVTISENLIFAIVRFMPSDIMARLEKAAQQVENLRDRVQSRSSDWLRHELEAAEANLDRSKRTVLNALLAARKNLRTAGRIIPAPANEKSRSAEVQPVITLAADKADKNPGYYYPEKGKTSWFEAHGRLPVDPNQIEVLTPTHTLADILREEKAAYASDPGTRLAMIRHGTFIYLVQAKKLNGRKLLFAKLIYDGSRYVRMTHWARISGGDPTALIRLSGIDPGKLDTHPSQSQ